MSWENTTYLHYQDGKLVATENIECTETRHMAWYARQASLTLKETAKIFRIGHDVKKVETTEYTENLMLYLDHYSSVDSLTLVDLKTALEKLQTV